MASPIWRVPGVACVVHVDRPVPIMHRYGYDDADPDARLFLACCRAPVRSYDHLLPIRHAAKFARPCGRCFRP